MESTALTVSSNQNGANATHRSEVPFFIPDQRLSTASACTSAQAYTDPQPRL